MDNVFSWKLIFTNIPELLKYLPITLEIAFSAYILSLIVGLGVALVKIKKPKILYPIICFYVSFTRGTPAIVQLYATYFGIPMILQLINYKCGTSYSTKFIPNVVFALVALTFNDAAYSSEYIRASIQSVDKGQREAARSIGMTAWQTMRRITIPEALVVAIPSLGNSLISMIKGTSLVFTCAVVDITAAGRLIAGRNYRYFEMYLSLAVIYWIITLVVAKLFQYLEKLVKCNEGEAVTVNDTN